MEHIIHKTENGRVYKCDKCSKIHVEFMVLNLNFSRKEYANFVNYVQNINIKQWQEKSGNHSPDGKFLVPIGHKHLSLLFKAKEMQELKQLMQPLAPVSLIENRKIKGVKYSMGLN